MELERSRALPLQVGASSDLDTQVDSWRRSYDGDRDPEDHFRELVSALQDYRREFAEDEEAISQLDAALGEIEKVVEDLRSELPPEPEPDDFYGGSSAREGEDASRSIFDDVDNSLNRKGCYRDAGAEGSDRQFPGPSNTKRIQGRHVWARRPIDSKPDRSIPEGVEVDATYFPLTRLSEFRGHFSPMGCHKVCIAKS
jgi:hypothetical protein